MSIELIEEIRTHLERISREAMVSVAWPIEHWECGV